MEREFINRRADEHAQYRHSCAESSVASFNEIALPFLKELGVFDPEKPMTYYERFNDTQEIYAAFICNRVAKASNEYEKEAARMNNDEAWREFLKGHDLPPIQTTSAARYDKDKGEFVLTLSEDSLFEELYAETAEELAVLKKLKAIQKAVDALCWEGVNTSRLFRNPNGKIGLLESLVREDLEQLVKNTKE